MTEYLLEHLSSTLTNNGIIAYVWNAGEDRFSWTGDLQRFLGLEKDKYPSSNADLHSLINPQDVHQRLSALNGILGNGGDVDSALEFTSIYKIRQASGDFIEIEEIAKLQEVDGKRVLCGHMKLKSSFNKSGTRPNFENVIPVMLDAGFNSYGRMTLTRNIEEWFDTYTEGERSSGYLLAVGIDRMALFNEVMGPRYADEIIGRTGERLQQIVGEAGVVTRVEGDVYGIFFRRAPHNEMAAVASYILNNFYNVPLRTTMGPIGVGISVGGVTMDRGKDAASIITMSEMAMHVAKDKGRSCFVSYDEASHKAEDNKRLLKCADTFMKAMKSNRLRLAFQPVMDTKANDVSFHECLMRLIDDDGKMISAGVFIPAIEQLGLSRLVDQYALRMAISELSMFPDLKLSVNVSNLSLNNQDWLRHLVTALRDRPSVAERLIIEITESAVIADIDHTKRIVSTLKDLGCRVALDDFGAGYTAFSQLKDLKVDLVKIDKSFIRNINEEHNHLFVKTLRALADGVNVQTVGEGAETLAEAQLLIDDGIHHIQGYVYGFPRVERLWLPKDHSRRHFLTEPGTAQGIEFTDGLIGDNPFAKNG